MACSGDNFEKTGSAIPTESGNSDTCDCKAGYYLDCAGLMLHRMPRRTDKRRRACDRVHFPTGSRASGGTSSPLSATTPSTRLPPEAAARLPSSTPT